jgi:hypothetical protein
VKLDPSYSSYLLPSAPYTTPPQQVLSRNRWHLRDYGGRHFKRAEVARFGSSYPAAAGQMRFFWPALLLVLLPVHIPAQIYEPQENAVIEILSPISGAIIAPFDAIFLEARLVWKDLELEGTSVQIRLLLDQQHLEQTHDPASGEVFRTNLPFMGAGNHSIRLDAIRSALDKEDFVLASTSVWIFVDWRTSVVESAATYLKSSVFKPWCEWGRHVLPHRHASDAVENGFRTFTIDEAREILPCLVAAPSSLSSNDVTFLVMSSSLNLARLQGVQRSWGSTASKIVYMGDEAKHGMTTLPPLLGRGSRRDAQHRTLLGMKWIRQQERLNSSKWFALMDDDTFVNVKVLSHILQTLDSSVPFMLGHVWDCCVARDSELPFTSGGAGIIVSKAAFDIIVPHLYTETCPFVTANDVTIGLCAKRLGVLQIHDSRFRINTCSNDGNCL